MVAPVNVLVCDDHTLVREGLHRLLSSEEGFKVIGEARDGREAVQRALETDPDVILMDVAMPALSGIEATRRILKAKPTAKIVILSMFLDDDYVAQAIDAGAQGYVLKDSPANELVEAIKAASAGQGWFSPQIRRQLIDRPRQGPRGGARLELTPREREVLQLLAEGHTVREIAGSLGLSAKTVDVHKTRLMKKLDIHNRAALVRYAVSKKLIQV